jgi:hypothetical protein
MIVPNPGDPQDLNRFSYVRNRPLNAVDPTGQAGVFGIKEWMKKTARKAAEALTKGWSRFVGSGEALKGIATYGPYVLVQDDFCAGSYCWGGMEYGRWLYEENIGRPEQRRRAQKAFANAPQFAELRRNNSLEAMARLSDFVAASGGTTREYMNDMAQLILDYDWYSGVVLPPLHRDPELIFNSTGFSQQYADPYSLDNNQVNHFWFFVNAAYQLGPENRDLVQFLALAHETNFPLIGGSAGGASDQDRRLSLLGIEIGLLIWSGEIQPDRIGDWMRFVIGH